MTLLRASIVGAVLLAGSPFAADAADLNGKMGGMKDGGYAAPVQAPRPMGGIYLRGDYTYAWKDLGSMYEPPAYELTQIGIDNGSAFGFGVGYHFSHNVRGDVTFDFGREADTYGAVLDGAATVQGVRRFGIKSNVALFNLYYDFDKGSRFSPYLGVGLGVAWNKTSGGFVDIAAAYPCVSNPTPCAATFDGAKKTNAAGALMAGFTSKITDRLSLDAGYRFLYLGDARTGDIVITNPNPGDPTGSPDPKVNDLHQHELRVGLRWDIK
jgi:opacity protein-like surface antigen